MNHLPPAIPDVSEIPQKLFYMGVMQEPFSVLSRDILRPSHGHYFKAPLPGQIDLWGCGNVR